MIGGGGGGAGTAAESAATWTAVVRLISSFRSFQEATLPVAKPSAQAERRAPMLAILVVASHSELLQEQQEQLWQYQVLQPLCRDHGILCP